MSTAWDNGHLRYAQLREVIAQLDNSPDGALVWDEMTATVFADTDDLLGALHDVWSRRLVAAVDNALELEGGDADAVGRAWQRVADQLPGVRRALEHAADNPSLRHQQLVEYRMLALAAGLTGLDQPLEHSARIGAELVRKFAPDHHSLAIPA